ncbi:hypothetical protein QKU48_gp0729 [Fadolivirus algeromassiliense]|jgi:hypothetical protein|uniref:Uncharacterized protein n=1 Tax=Fadolivirus FV1/VV64 TaxID=3070911 RepID=A0A7D3QUJ8_9VIRU|nr:hypothetical protein QKU48_gp0729 [Fadolivirus algeromassiliense]QKF94187.1 hypothetical protein Fadolivirus_1_729 [Fadolivirus FV1/VV64]
MFYGVYVYDSNSSGAASVYLIGMYETIDQAKTRLSEYLPNYQKHYHNSVRSNHMIGWVNQYKLGDIPYNGLTCNQPHSSVNLFDEEP